MHVPYCFYPDAVGGTEVYVESLARCLIERGLKSTIAAPGGKNAAYDSRGLAVRRFTVSDDIGDIRDLYGEGDRAAAMEFAKVLDDEQPDIVHLHAFTRGASLRLVREAKRRGIKVVFTYHTPTVSCQRGTLMRWGTEVCDGLLDTPQCAACTVQARGINETLARFIGSIPLSFSSLPGKCGLRGGAWTALRMTELIELRNATFRSLMEEADCVVALCQWTEDLLVRNGVPAQKIMLSRHGLSQTSEVGGRRSEVGGQTPAVNDQRSAVTTKSLLPNTQQLTPDTVYPQLSATCHAIRLAFLGRLEHSKGADILIKALRSLPDAPVELHLYGVIQSASGVAYLAALKSLAEGDRRIRFLPTVPAAQIVPLLRSYHLLAVPSQLLETGPLVVLEAFAAGLPVIGSNLGGIAELVRHEVDGLLVEPGSVAAWSQTIRRCCDDRDLLDSLCRGVCPPRTMDSVASEMMHIYQAGERSKEKHRRDKCGIEYIHAPG